MPRFRGRFVRPRTSYDDKVLAVDAPTKKEAVERFKVLIRAKSPELMGSEGWEGYVSTGPAGEITLEEVWEDENG